VYTLMAINSLTRLCINNFVRHPKLSKPKSIKIFVDDGQKLSTANHTLVI